MMNISISDTIKKIDEDLLWDFLLSKKDEEELSDERIQMLVFEEIEKETKTLKKKTSKSKKKIIIIALAAALALGTMVSAHYVKKWLEQNEVVNEENKHLIGTEVKVERNAEKLLDENLKPEEREAIMKEKLLASTSIIKDISDSVLIPSGVTEVVVEKSTVTDQYIYPSQILVNGDISILKNQDNTGWNLKNGDKVIINFSKYPTETKIQQTLGIGYVCNGILEEPNFSINENGNCEILISVEGEYYFYFQSFTSDYLTLHEEKINIYKK